MSRRRRRAGATTHVRNSLIILEGSTGVILLEGATGNVVKEGSSS